MAETNWSKRVFKKPGSFDVDMDDEYCGVIGGEIADWTTVGPAWDWRPDANIAQPAQRDRVLSQLDHSEFHTAREGSHHHGDREMSGQMDPVDRGTIEMFRGGPGNPGHRGSEIHDGFEADGPPSGGIDPVRAGSSQHGGGRGRGDRMDPARRGTNPYGERTRSGQIDPVKRGSR